jgi:hypothetical protein
MEFSSILPLTSTQQPALLSEEVQYRVQDSVDIYDRDVKSLRRRGMAIVTSHRVGWVSADRKDAIYWHLGMVYSVETEEGGLLVGSSKVVLYMESARPGAAPARGHIKLSFKEGGRDPFLDDLQRVLAKKSWVANLSEPVAKPMPVAADVARRPGIAGIVVLYVTLLQPL